MPRYRNNETSPLRFDETEIKEAIRQYMMNKNMEEADRIKHMMIDCNPDEHSYVPHGVNVHLHPKE